MENQEQVWNKIAPLWNEHKTEIFGTKDNLIEEFISKEDIVLDLGCGSGRNFIPRGKWYGIDFSKEMLEFAKTKNYVELKKANLWESEFNNEMFDKILCIASLHCIPNSNNRMKILKEIYRLLKKDGQAIITVWNKDSKRWKAKDKEKMVSWDIGNEKVERYYYLYNFDELKKDLESVGFKIISESYPLARNIVFRIEK
jgi:ubiquinone/menaquinone biosynthesis C-methylase UbiE